MKKIVHIIRESGKAPGGDARIRIVKELAQAQSKLDLSVSVWLIGGFSQANHLLSGVEVISFPAQRPSRAINPELREKIKVLDTQSIVHLHGGFIPEFYGLTAYLREVHPSISVVLSPQGDYNEPDLRNLSIRNRIFYYLYERVTIKRSTLIHLIGPSEVNGYNFFMDHSTPFVCLPHGVRNGHAFPIPDNSARQDFTITHIGVQNFYAPGIDILCEAFALLKEKTVGDVRLQLVGEGRDLEAIKSLIGRLSLNDFVVIRQKMSTEEKERLLHQTAVYVQPSRNEHFPIEALEAASRSVPLIVSEETNLGNFVRQYEAGWSLSRNNVEHLSESLLEAYHLYNGDDATFQRLRRNAYRMVQEELNWHTLAKKWREVYLGLGV